MSQPVGRRRPGGRSARVRQAVLEAAVGAVAKGGIDAVNIGEIARSAGVHDSSIYRRWPTKEHLVFDALVEYNRELLPVPDTGSLRGDLLGYLGAITNHTATPIGRAMLKAMVHTNDDESMAARRADFWETRLARTRTMFDRAVERGELDAEVDPRAALELLTGAIYFRLLLTREPVDPAITGHFIDILIGGLARPNHS